MKIDEGVNWKIHGKVRQMLNSKAKSQTCDHSKNPISFSTKLCLSCPRIPYKVLLTAECWHYQFFINSEKSHLWRWVIIVSRILFYILVFWPNQSKMTIHNIVNDVTKNWIQWKQETDVDINYQHFDFLCVPNCTQWNFNGLLYNKIICQKNIVNQCITEEGGVLEKKDTIDYFATQCLKIFALEFNICLTLPLIFPFTPSSIFV